MASPGGLEKALNQRRALRPGEAAGATRSREAGAAARTCRRLAGVGHEARACVGRESARAVALPMSPFLVNCKRLKARLKVTLSPEFLDIAAMEVRSVNYISYTYISYGMCSHLPPPIHNPQTSPPTLD